MTACFVNITKNKEIVLAADTLVSANAPIKSNSYLVDLTKGFEVKEKIEKTQQGFTSLGQKYIQKPDYKDGSFTYFAENAAKIGIINGKFPFNCSGEEESILLFIELLLLNENKITDLGTLELFVKETLNKIEQMGKLGSLMICFGVPISETQNIVVYLVTSQGVKSFGIEKGLSETNWMHSFGSGADEISRKYDSRFSIDICSTENEMFDMLPTLVMSDLSTLFSGTSQNPIPTDFFGGPFLAFGLKNSKLTTPKTFIHLSIDEDDIITFAIKVHYENGIFYLQDLIGKNLTALETIDRRVRKPKPELPIHAIPEVAKHQAPWVFMTFKEKDGSTMSDIAGNGTKNAFIGNVQTPWPDGFNPEYWFGPGMEFTITRDGKPRVLKAKLRI